MYENDNSNRITCGYCPKGSVIDSNGKCLKCKDELGNGCSDCMNIIDKDKKEKLVCTQCISNYFLTPSGHCIYPKNYYEYIPNCDTINARIITNSKNSYNYNILYYSYEIWAEEFEISSSDCQECFPGYYNEKKMY